MSYPKTRIEMRIGNLLGARLEHRHYTSLLRILDTECVRKVTVHLRYPYVDLVVSIEVAVEVCCCRVKFHCIQLLNSG
jgi:hypothetical protein